MTHFQGILVCLSLSLCLVGLRILDFTFLIKTQQFTAFFALLIKRTALAALVLGQKLNRGISQDKGGVKIKLGAHSNRVISFRRWIPEKNLGLALGILFSTALSSCISNNLGTVQPTSESITTEVPSGGTQSNQTLELLTIRSVLKSTIKPTQFLDLIGDGTGGMGQFCGQKTSSSASSSTATCNCHFSYKKADGNFESFEVPVLYGEQDLLRCDYSSIPTQAQTIEVKVHITYSDSFSNGVKFSFHGATVSVDTSDPVIFREIFRFECTSLINVPYLFDGSVYDPFQSEDPEIQYPFNFYTNNLAASLASINSKTFWECGTTLKAKTRIFSKIADSSGGKLIHNPSSATKSERSVFYLPPTSTGVFNIPVNSYYAPESRTVSNSETAPPIGFGAAPIPKTDSITGSETEECPTGAKIPPGYKWVKVWQFRASLDTRKYRSSTKFLQNGQIACNPADWRAANNAGRKNPFEDCASTGVNATRKTDGTSPTSSEFYLFDRLMGTNACVRLQINSADLSTINTNQTSDGGDKWLLTSGAGSIACQGDQSLDIFNFCPNPATAAAPRDPAPDIQTIDSESLYDFLFVVTPTTVHLKDLKNPDDTTGNKYVPIRYYSQCAVSDPATDSTQCPDSKIIRYSIKLHDINENADASEDSKTNSRLPVFPICALQPETL